ncbi:MAG: hypothetical protein HY553_01460 [Elusimicrobia bacterium]|nr:hypothetical protein [Elusimicrobiota bacterium]
MPRNWQESSGAGSLHVRAPEAVREVGAFISVYPGSPDTRAELEESIESAKRTFRGDPNFSSHPLVEVAVGGTRGYMRSETMTGFRKLFHRKTPLPEPVKVRRTIVSFNVGATGYEIMYMAPLELYDKHLPAFERVLRTLKVEPKP